MSKRRVLRIDELREQGTEALGGTTAIEIPIDGGDPVTIAHPLLYSDEQQEAIEAADGTITLAKIILGDEEHTRFLAAGGHSNDIAMAYRMLADGMLGKGVPQRLKPRR